MDKSNVELVREALDIRFNAYAEYSKFRVGALVVSDDDKVYYGVNVENKSYGLTICAERNAIFNGITNGMKKIKKLVVASDLETIITPCGACREVIREFSDENTEIIMASKSGEIMIKKASELLPFGFDFK